MRDDRRSRGKRQRRSSGRGRPQRGRFDDLDDRFDDDDDYGDDDADDYDDEPPRSRRKRPPARRRREAPPRRREESRRGSRRGRSAGRRGKAERGFDWDALDEEEDDRGGLDDRYDDYDDYEDEAPRPKRRRKKRAPARRKMTLMDLCTPVFGFCMILPRDAEGAQPDYEQFREEVVTALNKIESEAPEHGIEVEDARHAGYALCLLIDTQVAESEWVHKERWSSEPLHIMIQQDAEGGVNFFRRLDEFGERQKAVKEVYLVCLAMGFRGKYAEMEATEQAAKIGEIRQKLVRNIHPVPLEKQRELFPKAYREARAIEDDVPPPPRWWMFASLGVVAFVLIIWFVLFWIAGRSPRPATETLAGVQVDRTATAYRAVQPPVDEPAPVEPAAEEEGQP